MRRLALALLGLALAGCGADAGAPAAAGNPERGRLLLRQYGCGGCHHIPGVAAADGNTGPPLDRIARRVYVGGVLANTPENLARWIRAPQAIDPRTRMPDMQVSAAHARDMTAYLYRLK
jgi:cytochrome c1